MKSFIQASILLVVAALVVQQVVAQPTLQTIEVQFRIVTEYIVRTSNELVHRCMRYNSETQLLAFVNTTWDQDRKLCQSTDTLFTIVQTQSETEGNFFIGDYSAGTAKQVYDFELESNKRMRAFTVDASGAVARVKLNDTTNWLNSLSSPDRTAVSDGKHLYNIQAVSNLQVPLIMRVIPNPLRQFRLKRLDPHTEVTSCATLLGASKAFIRFPLNNTQEMAEYQCGQKRSVFTFDTETGQLSIGGRRVRVDEKGRLRTAVNDTQPSNSFYLRPENFGFDSKNGCKMCRIDGGLMVAQPASMLTTGPNGYVVANGDYDYYRTITSEFWPEFI